MDSLPLSVAADFVLDLCIHARGGLAIEQIDVEADSLHEEVDVAAAAGRHLGWQCLALLHSLHDAIPTKAY